MLRVEFHCHTSASKDSLLPPQRLLDICRRRQIDRVVITDHNTILGGLQAQQLDPDRVIVGEEVMTQEGELLAAYVSEQVPAGMPAREAIALLRQQGAFISVSHPFDIMRSGHWKLADLEKILPLVDALETFNARCWFASFNRQAQVFAHQHGILGTAGSDAHAGFEVGRATMLLPHFDDPVSLKAALHQAEIHGRLSLPLVHFASRYAKWRKAWEEHRKGN